MDQLFHYIVIIHIRSEENRHRLGFNRAIATATVSLDSNKTLTILVIRFIQHHRHVQRCHYNRSSGLLYP